MSVVVTFLGDDAKVLTSLSMPAVPRVGDFVSILGAAFVATHVRWDVYASGEQKLVEAYVIVTRAKPGG